MVLADGIMEVWSKNGFLKRMLRQSSVEDNKFISERLQVTSRQDVNIALSDRQTGIADRVSIKTKPAPRARKAGFELL